MLPHANRRELLAGLAAAVGLFGGAALAQDGLRFGARSAFSFGRLKDRARNLAKTSFVAPTPPNPKLIAAIDYDAVGQINYRPDKTLWRDRGGDATLRFFHLGRYANVPVRIHVVDDGAARELLYLGELFERPKQHVSRRLTDDLGFAGFRAMEPGAESDWIAYQGASYFRAASAAGQYGLSARGLAIDTATPQNEEFPAFTDLWLERDDSGALIVYALLDGPSVAGAYKFACRRTTKGVVQEVESELHFRAPVLRLGVAPLTSMFWYGEQNRRQAIDWRPEIHDSDGLAMWTGTGERIWRPLNNPPRVITNVFTDKNPRGFGLMQRDRNFENYQDDGAFYDRRPSLWVEPVGDWGEGQVQLVEIPTDSETNDNIVAFWTPAQPVKAGSKLDFRYRLLWQDAGIVDESYARTAKVVATRIGIGGRPGQPVASNAVTKIMVDFEGETLNGLTRESGVQAALEVQRGIVRDSAVYPVVGAKRWRMMADVEAVPGPDPVDLRAYLRLNDQSLSETWMYQLFPTAQ